MSKNHKQAALYTTTHEMLDKMILKLKETNQPHEKTPSKADIIHGLVAKRYKLFCTEHKKG
ncbi:MAG: hypothetical protein GY782_03650 [Gammaproteobacteria bacterium]|nr:hypothetical protein [Gammaproteobacteria bacterium]